MAFNVLPWSQINGLVQGIALSKCIQVSDLNDLTNLWNAEVGRYCYIASHDPAFAVEQTQFHAPFVVNVRNNRRASGVELVL